MQLSENVEKVHNFIQNLPKFRDEIKPRIFNSTAKKIFMKMNAEHYTLFSRGNHRQHVNIKCGRRN